MGLASALSTALTGLNAAETTIDVVGNNVANSNTVGFKASVANFSTQFLQTNSLGSSPTETRGGTNPRQVGLGTQVAEITPNFTQGTIEVSTSASDLAIQGDGFFIVEGNQGESLYTRNGIFKTNAENELVTITGNRLLGYGVDDNFQVQVTTLQPLTIPLGGSTVAQATQNVFFEGTLTPTGDIATTAEIIQTAILGDGSTDAPATAPTGEITEKPADVGGNGITAAAGALSAGAYRYKVVFVDPAGNESTPSDFFEVTGVAANDRIDLTGIDVNDAPADYTERRIYRTLVDPTNTSPYYLVGTIPDNTTTTFSDGASDVAINVPANQLNQTTLTGTYSYYITLVDTGGAPESRPAGPTVPINVFDGRLLLDSFPPIPAGSIYDSYRIYRNLASDNSRFYEVATLPGTTTQFVDNRSDTDIQVLVAGVATGRQVNLDGPPILPSTLLTDVLRRDSNTYSNAFVEGTLHFTGKKGERTLTTKDFEITNTSTVLDLLNFMTDALGIQQVPGPDSLNPIPPDASGQNPGGSVTADGRMQLVGNNGVANAVEIGLAGMQLETATSTDQITLPFGSSQSAVGQGAVSDFVVYDSLGIPLNVRVTTVLQSRDSASTVYRWFADSGENDPLTGARIAVGTGLIEFDGEGNVATVANDAIAVDRRHIASTSPLEITLNFDQLSGLATERSTLSATRQDGSAPGTLSSFIIGESGLIRGVFSNGVSRDLGQIVLARFANATGLEQKGLNLFATGVNSGLPITGNPGEQGIGTIVAGAVELSNTDIGGNLIDLILASTQYRGNARVITATQELFDELLNLRR